MKEVNWEREQRKQNRLEKLGTNEPRCGMCGEDHWTCFEAHHVAGRKFDPMTVRLCMNCHRKVADDQSDHPPFNPDADPTIQAIGHSCLA